MIAQIYFFNFNFSIHLFSGFKNIWSYCYNDFIRICSNVYYAFSGIYRSGSYYFSVFNSDIDAVIEYCRIRFYCNSSGKIFSQ